MLCEMYQLMAPFLNQLFALLVTFLYKELISLLQKTKIND